MSEVRPTLCLVLFLLACGSDASDATTGLGTATRDDEADAENVEGANLAGSADAPAADAGVDQTGAEGTAGVDRGAAGVAAEPQEGACSGRADMAVLSDTSVAQLSCEGGACIARNLRLSLTTSSIDRDGARACLAGEAPMLQRLSPGCRECFLQISLCAPESCVSLLGGESDACLGDGLPSTEFAGCGDPPAPSASCDACQASCRKTFLRCSGLSGGSP